METLAVVVAPTMVAGHVVADQVNRVKALQLMPTVARQHAHHRVVVVHLAAVVVVLVGATTSVKALTLLILVMVAAVLVTMPSPAMCAMMQVAMSLITALTTKPNAATAVVSLTPCVPA